MMEHPFSFQEGDAGVAQNSQETLVNMYAEIETSGKSKLVRRQRPGLNTTVLVANIIVLVNQNRNPSDDQIENWDNNLTF